MSSHILVPTMAVVPTSRVYLTSGSRISTWILAIGIGIAHVGCRSKTGNLTDYTADVFRSALVGWVENDEGVIEVDRQAKTERAWKWHWRENPDQMPVMSKKFKDDYR
ncbi:MAG: hypothetical protein KF752_02305 [Pirellulaceae bacterium]|nr:hypothetical protein [Pirellulaceae bacterium]